MLNHKIKKIEVTSKNLKDFIGVEKFDYNKVGKNDTNLNTLLKQFPEIKRIINNAQND